MGVVDEESMVKFEYYMYVYELRKYYISFVLSDMGASVIIILLGKQTIVYTHLMLLASATA